MCPVDGQRTVRGGEIIIGGGQAGHIAGDGIAADACGSIGRAIADGAAADHTQPFAIDEAGDGLGKGGIGLTIKTRLIVRRHRQMRPVDGGGDGAAAQGIIRVDGREIVGGGAGIGGGIGAGYGQAAGQGWGGVAIDQIAQRYRGGAKLAGTVIGLDGGNVQRPGRDRPCHRRARQQGIALIADGQPAVIGGGISPGMAGGGNPLPA